MGKGTRPFSAEIGRCNCDIFVKSRHPGEACAGLDPVTGVQKDFNSTILLDSDFRRNDGKRAFSTFYESINYQREL